MRTAAGRARAPAAAGARHGAAELAAAGWAAPARRGRRGAIAGRARCRRLLTGAARPQVAHNIALARYAAGGCRETDALVASLLDVKVQLRARRAPQRPRPAARGARARSRGVLARRARLAAPRMRTRAARPATARAPAP